MKTAIDNKSFYDAFADKINSKRLNSPYKVRRYAHVKQYTSILDRIAPGELVLDAGCGEGALSVMMAMKGANVTGVDLSRPNIEEAKKYAAANGVNITFAIGDLEELPFPDNSFDTVVCSHVLEHIPNFDKGLQELARVARKKVIFAVPTALNCLSFVQLGGGQYYAKGPRAFAGLPIGALKVLWAALTGKEGVDEGYCGTDMEHIFRFPKVVRKKLKKYNLKLVDQEASTLALPYFETLLPISRALDKLSNKPIFRNFGYGTTFVVDVTKE